MRERFEEFFRRLAIESVEIISVHLFVDGSADLEPHAGGWGSGLNDLEAIEDRLRKMREIVCREDPRDVRGVDFKSEKFIDEFRRRLAFEQRVECRVWVSVVRRGGVRLVELVHQDDWRSAFL